MCQPVLVVLTHKFFPRNMAVIDYNSQAIMHYLNLLKVPVFEIKLDKILTQLIQRVLVL